MVSKQLDIVGCALLSPLVFTDNRGAFEVFWEREITDNTGICFQPESSHHSYNRKSGTIRAFHYQSEPHCQSKLVSCVAGKVWDVVVDLRAWSPTYRRWIANELSAEDGCSVYIPRGCAHGFATLEDNSTVAYLIEGEYVAEASVAIRWNDPTLAVPWPIKNPTLSVKDRNAPFLEP